MTINELAERIYLNLPFQPNEQQVELIAALAKFCSPLLPGESVFILNGYAGTGKTSLTGALVRALKEARRSVTLLAPTGRAAKVFSKMAGHKAWTIHRRIYRSDDDGVWTGTLAYNPVRNGIFIVDEASMIGGTDDSEFGINLLEDLIQFVYSGEGCKLILLGDIAQLPPVGCEESPAMDVQRLKAFGLRVSRAILTKVVRQTHRSGILYNATWLRKAMLLPQIPDIMIRTRGFKDIRSITQEEIKEEIEHSYSSVGEDNTIIITRSNKRASLYNQAVRTNIMERYEVLSKGERLMVVRNNYLWAKGIKGLDFIANGDMCLITAIYGVEDRYGFRFANVRLSFPDLDKELDCKVIVDTLFAEGASLSSEEYTSLYNAVLSDPENVSNAMTFGAKMIALKTNPYLNALQIKYGYAVTCHKSQGGQWDDVYIDMGNPITEMNNKEFYRWLYTAVTRAKTKLFLVNPGCKIE